MATTGWAPPAEYGITVEEAAYRRLDTLISQGARLGAVRSELELQPLEERADLCRYAWGLLDRRYGTEEEAALWLYAWGLGSRARGKQNRPRSQNQ